MEDTTYESLDQLPYADAVLREALRLFPGAATGNREAEKDCYLDGEPAHQPLLTAVACAACSTRRRLEGRVLQAAGGKACRLAIRWRCRCSSDL